MSTPVLLNFAVLAASVLVPLDVFASPAPANGAILTDQYADVPGVDAAYSSWVETGNEGFHQDHGQIKVTGQYFLLNDPQNRKPFTTTLPTHPPK